MPEDPSEEDLNRYSVIVSLETSFKNGITGEIIKMPISLNLTRYRLDSAADIKEAHVLEDLRRPEVAGLLKPELPVTFVVTGGPQPSIGGVTQRWLSSAYKKQD